MSSTKKEGWCTKLGGFVKNWKRRWFVFDGKTISYYEKPGKPKPSGVIDMSKVSKIEPYEKCKKPNAFTVSIFNARVYQISCDTEDDLQSWLEVLKWSAETKCRPATIDDFEILKVLGRGTFGKVQLVRDKRDGAFYAMKSLSKSRLSSKRLIPATLAERDLMLKLTSPFLLSMRYTFQTDTTAFFVTPYLQGGELYEFLNNVVRLPEDRITLYAAMIALGIQCLHDNQIIHRDLKPENIMFGTDGYLCIIDFGLVKDLSTGSVASTFCGSTLYQAPEMLKNEAYSYEIDWWALGVLTYEMFFGFPPFYDDNLSNLYHQIVSEPPPFAEEGIELSDAAIDFLWRILDKDPQTRLGHNGVIDLKLHPLFANVDWDRLARKEVAMVWTPQVTDPLDTSFFDATTTDEQPGLTYEAPSGFTIGGFSAVKSDDLDDL